MNKLAEFLKERRKTKTWPDGTDLSSWSIGTSIRCIEELERLEAENERLRAARNLAYGFLWRMSIDRRRPPSELAYRARRALLDTMPKEEQAAGIEAARAALSEKDE